MRGFYLFLGSVLLWSACTPEYVPPSTIEDIQNAILPPTNDPTGKTGSVVASFLSSEHQFTFSQSTMSTDTLRVSYVSTGENFDVFRWEFEGGVVSSAASSSIVSGTSIVQGSLDDPDSASDIGVLVSYTQGFGRYNVTHAVANASHTDYVTEREYVTYEYLDDLKIQSASQATGWTNPQEGWFSPSTLSTVTYTPCENSMIGYYQPSPNFANEIASVSKDFSNFGTNPKNLVFEYKMEFLVLPSNNNQEVKLSLGYTPLVQGAENLSIDPSIVWSEKSYDITEFRQVILPLPLIPNFRLTFFKHLSELDNDWEQLYPFSVCVRNIKIIPSNE